MVTGAARGVRDQEGGSWSGLRGIERLVVRVVVVVLTERLPRGLEGRTEEEGADVAS